LIIFNVIYKLKYSSIIIKGIPMAKKKFAKLELILRHLQQNVEIPKVSFYIHPKIQEIVNKV